MSPRKVIDRQIDNKHWEAYENGSVYADGYLIIQSNGKVSSGTCTANDVEIALALHKEAPKIEIPDILYEPPSVEPPAGRVWRRTGNTICDWEAVDPNDDEISDGIPYEEEIQVQEILLAAAKEIYARKASIMSPNQVLANAHMEKLSSLVLELMCSKKDKIKIFELIEKINPVWEALKFTMYDENLNWVSK
jgi:hypothetical protein